MFFSRHGWKFFVLLWVVVAACLWFVTAPLLSKVLSEKLNISVSFQSIRLTPSHFRLGSFRVKNPWKYEKNYAMKAKTIEVDYKLSTFFSDKVEIASIVLDDVYINLELSSKDPMDNNWAAIALQMPKREKKEGKKKPVLIHKLVINNLAVETRGKGSAIYKIKGARTIEKLELDDINSEDGFPTKDLVFAIFKEAGVSEYLKRFVTPVEPVKSKKKWYQFFKKEEPSEEGPATN